MVRTNGAPGGRAALAGLLLAVVLAVALGGCASSGPVAVELDVLAEQQERWHGRAVEATGVVRSYQDPLHFWIEDEAHHRVELWPPEGAYAELVGQAVTVRGRFTFVEGEGRRIEVEDLLRTG